MTDWDKLIPPGQPIKEGKIIFTGIDLGTEDKLAVYAVKDDKIIDWVELPICKVGEELIIKNETNKPLHIREHSNLKPTHDPYTNPNSLIYYECKCGAILDPGTKSFAALNGHASKEGWKIRFTSDGYIPYCVKCGKNVD